jgi:ABC-type Co2+ transport system permease subunit
MSWPSLELPVAPTQHTASAVRAIRDARVQVPCHGSLCAALDLADPAGTLDPAAYGEAVGALDVGARVFGHDAAIEIGAHCEDAALVFDIAVYHLTGAAADIPAALGAFRRAAGPLLERTRTV